MANNHNHDNEGPPVNSEVTNRLSQIEADLSSQDSWARAFKEAVDRRFDDLKSALNDLRSEISRKERPVPWVQIGALLVGVVGVMTAYINTRLAPLESAMVEARRDQREYHDQHSKIGSEIAYLRGFQEATNTYMVEEVKEVRQRLREAEGKLPARP